MLEELYDKVINDVLPTIQKGLVITKDYFVDLFGRYVKYLIVTDAMWALLGFLLFAGFAIVVYRKRHLLTELDEYNVFLTARAGGTWAALIISVCVGLPILLVNLDDLIKDIFIPEIRVYEELKSFTQTTKVETK